MLQADPERFPHGIKFLVDYVCVTIKCCIELQMLKTIVIQCRSTPKDSSWESMEVG